MTQKLCTDVLIIGAGPTGLALAATLAQRSVPALVVDRALQGTNTSRAAVIHARTLDVLDRIGLAGPLITAGLVVPRFSARHQDRVLMDIDFAGIGSPHPYTLMLPQSSTETLLAELLPADLPVLRGLSIESFADDGKQISAIVVDEQGLRTEVQARMLVGCDGMHSRVRDLAGIGFRGEKYLQSFLLADVQMSWPIPRDEAELFFSPDGLMVVAPLPGDRFRIVATAEARTAPDRGAIQRILNRRGPRAAPAIVTDLAWSSHFEVHHRLADSYRRGNVFLAGDAAHVHSPAGGQGMNLGIQDAVELGDLLADSESDSGRAADLDSYERRRRPQAKRVVRLTDVMTRAATARSVPVQRVRDRVVRFAGRLPAVPRMLARALSGANLGS